MNRHILLGAVCLIILSNCSVFKKTQNKQSNKKKENEELVIDITSNNIAERYKSLIQTNRTDYGVRINKIVEFKGKLYLILNGSNYCNELWEFDGDTSLNKLIDYSHFEEMEAQGKSELKYDTGNEWGNSVRGINSLAVANNKLYFSFTNGHISNRLFQYSLTKGPLIIDGVTNVKHITAWENFGLIYSAIDDNNLQGIYTVDENNNAILLTECNTFYPYFIQDGIPYGRCNTLPVINNKICITSNGCPTVIKQDGVYISWNFPEKFRINRWAKIENGVFIVDNLYGTFLRIENDCKKIKNAFSLPEYMHVYKIDENIKSIDNTVYFNAKLVPPSSESKVLYYKNEKEFGDVTEIFKNNDIKVKDLITSFQGNLIIGKSIKIEGIYRTVLQKYNPETNKLIDITFLGNPMEINKNSVAFKYKEYLYFVGNNNEKKNCLWRYDGINDPKLIEFKNTSN